MGKHVLNFKFFFSWILWLPAFTTFSWIFIFYFLCFVFLNRLLFYANLQFVNGMWIFNVPLPTREHADLWAECRKDAIKMDSQSESKVGWMGQMGLSLKERLGQGQNHTKLTFTSRATLLAILMCLKGEPKALFDFCFCFQNTLCKSELVNQNWLLFWAHLWMPMSRQMSKSQRSQKLSRLCSLDANLLS